MAKKQQTANEVELFKPQYNLPGILPEMDKKELFNTLAESKPLSELVGENFSIIGLLPEMVEVPRNAENEEEELFGSDETVERERLTLMTDKGVYHSFSVTFKKSLMKAYNIFGNDFINETYELTSKQKGGKNYYILKVK